MKKLELAIEIFGEEVVNEIANQLKIADKDATGDLIRSLDSNVIKNSKGFTIQLLANDYYQYVDNGRKPGKMPPIRAISKWVNARGISADAAWPIAKSIGMNGIRATNVTDKTIKQITQNRKYKQFEDDLVDWVDDAIDNLLNNIEGDFIKVN